MSLGVIPVVLVIVGLVVVAAVTSLIAYIVTASRKRSTAGSAPSSSDHQPADLAHALDDAESDGADRVTGRTRTRSHN